MPRFTDWKVGLTIARLFTSEVWTAAGSISAARTTCTRIRLDRLQSTEGAVVKQKDDEVIIHIQAHYWTDDVYVLVPPKCWQQRGLATAVKKAIELACKRPKRSRKR